MGTGTYVSPAGKEMHYELKGVIGVPEGSGSFPLVLITHGSHSNDNESLCFDTGFSYLAEELAKNGFVAVSMDMSKAYIWKYGDNDDREKSRYLAAEHLNSLLLASSRELSGQLTGKEQEQFLQNFAADFFHASLHKGTSVLSLDHAQLDLMYGDKVNVLYRNAQSQKLFSAGKEANYSTTNLSAEVKRDAWFHKQDELMVDTITYGEEEQQSRQLLKLDWEEVPALWRLMPGMTDWQEYSALTIDLVVNAADEKNENMDYQKLSFVLTDTQGNTAKVNLPDQLEALKKTIGEIDSTPLIEETIYFWSIPTPLSSVILPYVLHIYLSFVMSIELTPYRQLRDELPPGLPGSITAY